MNAAAANAAAHPAISRLEFMVAMMHDPSVDSSLRFKAAQASAMYIHPKPQAAPPGDGDGATIIEHHRSAEEAALVAEAERQSDLRGRQELAELIDEPDPLTEQEQIELKALNAKGLDLMAALPTHLRPVVIESDEDRELRDLLRNDWPPEPPRPPTEAPGEHRRRLLSERHAPVERKGPPPSNDDRE